MSATFREVDETVERELFARRARAMGEQTGVPSLESVLRAVREEEAIARPAAEPVRDDRVARGMRWSSVVLAAACFLVVLRTAPRPAVSSVIAADDRPDIAWSASEGSSTCEESQENVCHMDRSMMPATVSEPVTSVAPAGACAAADRGTCEEAIATYAPPRSAPVSLSCAGDESGPPPAH